MIVSLTRVISGALLACPSAKKPTKEIKNAGIVVHIIFLIWAKSSDPATAEAKLVESDNGDILSPKIAPDKIAPATKAGFKPIVIPIPKIAIPTVEIVVKPLPIDNPTNEQTIKADGTKNLTLKLLKPKTIKAGMMPALIQTAIKVPINKKIKIGMIAVVIPSVIPSCTSSQVAFLTLAHAISKATTNKTGNWGERPNPMTPVPKMANIKTKIIIASPKFIFFILIIPPNLKLSSLP